MTSSFASRSFELLETTVVQALVSPSLMTGFRRMFYFHLLLTLAKSAEFYDKYRTHLPAEVRDAWKDFRNWAESSRLRDFRNKYVGHIWDKVTQRPLNDEELLAYVDRIVGPDRDRFLRWVNNGSGNAFPETVVAIVEHTRNLLQAAYDLSERETLPTPTG